MKIILREAKIIDKKSPFHNKTLDIAISDGFVSNIDVSIPNTDGAEELKLDNLHVSEGWFDSSVSFGEPGFEERETISNGLLVAAKSGFTAVALQPNSYPVLDNQSQISFVKNKSINSATELFPVGALTKDSKGIDLAELYDMKKAGAVAFGDYAKSIENLNLLKIALQYAQDFDALIIAFAQDENLKGKGVANEGIVSTRLGLKGISNLCEEIQIVKNLFLLEYTGGKMHIPTISTKKSVELIRAAKKKGLNVSCSVAVHHLVITDEKLEEFDSRYKISPPLRTEQDRKSLIDGVLDGTIDIITSDHNPIDIEHKMLEFDLSKNGTIGLESAFGTLTGVLPLEIVIEKLTAGKSIFGIERNSIQKGEKACLSLFNPEGKSFFTKDNILSKSKNSAFIGQEMTGKAYGIINQNQLVLS